MNDTPALSPTSPVTLLAHELINGEKRDAYGDAGESFAKIASMWSGLLRCPVTPRQVCLCMIALKLCRDANKSSKDNMIDVCGYAELADGL